MSHFHFSLVLSDKFVKYDTMETTIMVNCCINSTNGTFIPTHRVFGVHSGKMVHGDTAAATLSSR